jgi:hypothetical protein
MSPKRETSPQSRDRVGLRVVHGPRHRLETRLVHFFNLTSWTGSACHQTQLSSAESRRDWHVVETSALSITHCTWPEAPLSLRGGFAGRLLLLGGLGQVSLRAHRLPRSFLRPMKTRVLSRDWAILPEAPGKASHHWQLLSNCS